MIKAELTLKNRKIGVFLPNPASTSFGMAPTDIGFNDRSHFQKGVQILDFSAYNPLNQNVNIFLLLSVPLDC